MTSHVTIATYNTPGRLAPHKEGLQALADAGVDIIAVQEHRDGDDWSPRGWRRWRPRTAQSTTVYWNPDTVTAKKKGHKRMSSPSFHEYRGLTWVHFRTKIGPIRLASAHPPAFKTSRPSHAREYRRQMKRMAEWITDGTFRVIAGDLNGQVPETWTKPLADVVRASDKVASGPGGKKIDYILTNRRGPYKPIRTRLGNKYRSDHRPVIVEIVKR